MHVLNREEIWDAAVGLAAKAKQENGRVVSESGRVANEEQNKAATKSGAFQGRRHICVCRQKRPGADKYLFRLGHCSQIRLQILKANGISSLRFFVRQRRCNDHVRWWLQLREGANLVNRSQLDRNWHPQKSIRISSFVMKKLKLSLVFLADRRTKTVGTVALFATGRPFEVSIGAVGSMLNNVASFGCGLRLRFSAGLRRRIRSKIFRVGNRDCQSISD